MQLRPYQNEAVEAVIGEWNKGRRRTLLVLPTGTGKTVVFAKVAERVAMQGKRTLVLAHRGELLDQARDKIGKVAGLACSVERAEETSIGSWESVTVGSVQTLMRDNRLNAMDPDRFGAIVVDEAHHAASDSYRKVLDHFTGANVLGVTATPDRADRKDLGTVFDSLAYEYTLPAAIREGYLCPIQAQTIPLNIDISSVSTQSGDYAVGELGDALEPYLEAIADEMVAAGCRDRRTVVFLPLVRTAKRFRDILLEHGLRAAEVDGQSPDREQVLRDFQDGSYDVLCNSMLLTEGWDCPAVDCIVVLRATKSRALYCLDEQTEVLTRDGWKTDVEVGEEVLAFDRETGETRFVPTLAKVRRKLEPDEYFCSIKGQSSDIRVTNHHRMLYDNKRRKGWKVKDAEYLASLKDGAFIPVSGYGKFSGVPLTDAELTFIGWVMTDGNINRLNNQITITQGEQQTEYCEEIEQCIKECGFKFNRFTRKRKSGEIHWNANGDMVTWTISKGKPRGRDKHMTGWGRLEPWLSKDLSPLLFDMTERQFAVMLEAIYHGDGNKAWKTSYHIGKGNRTFIERLQMMGIQRGYRASVSVEKNNEVRKCDLWKLHIKKQDFIKIGSTSCKHATWEIEPHTDEACWCVQNELGTIVTRRNGKVAIVGNCQMVGRGTRLSPGKDHLLLLDFLWMTGRHELCRPASIVARSAEVAQKMTESMAADGGPVDLMEAEAQGERDAQREREDALAAELAAQRHKAAKLVDPLQYEMSIMDVDLQSYEPTFAWQMAEPTQKQLDTIERFGINSDGITDAGKATMLLDRLFKRVAMGLATPKQIRFLERKGFQHVGSWTFEQASKMIGRISKCGWRVPPGIDPYTYVPPTEDAPDPTRAQIWG